MQNERDGLNLLPGWAPAGDAEKYFGLTRGIIRKWIERGIRIQPDEARKIGRDWWVNVSALERILKEIEQPIND